VQSWQAPEVALPTAAATLSVPPEQILVLVTQALLMADVVALEEQSSQLLAFAAPIAIANESLVMLLAVADWLAVQSSH
jgi:hypothetical protein